jgi:TATA-binding protein-associated factor
LIFVQLKGMIDIIENQLLKKYLPSVSYLRLDGSVDVSERHNLVQKFNDDPSIDLLLMTTRVGGLGLNLTGADTVIFVEHDWNPMADLQAMDRAHRLGQKKVVNVYRLITKNTLEEKIMGLQRFKLHIANSVINQQNATLTSMDTDQILDLFQTPPVGAQEAKKKAVDPNKKASAKAILENLEELWDEKQYEEFDAENFVDSLN